ncbi:MAG: carboxypeptidase-like regulatory domain-containing protein [Candidatus Sumerlaeia bacterium]|nr:carboxypeptidase-like regulatory domain-containing protein [Candidatus Sumerlaeia bacterium]
MALRTLLALLLALWACAAPAQDLRIEDLNDEFAAPENPLRADGSVRTADGPASNVQVILEVTDMRIRRQVEVLRTRTDANGEFSFDLSKFAIPRFGLQFNTRSPRFVEALKIVRADSAELPVRVDLVVEPGAAATGTVRDRGGNPLEGVSISAPGMSGSTSERGGAYEFFGLPVGSPTTIRFSKSGFTDGFLEIVPEQAELLEGQDIVLEPAAPLKGVVLDPLGNPAKQASIVFSSPTGWQRERVKTDGTFELRAVPEEVEEAVVEAMAPEWLPVRRPLSEAERGGGGIELRLRAGVTLAGRISGPDGAAAGGASVVLADPRGREVARALADAEGRWSLGPFETATRFTAVALPASTSERRDSGEFFISAMGADGTGEGVVEPWPGGYSSDFRITLEGDTVRMERRDRGSGGLPGVVRYEGRLDAEKMQIEGRLTVEATGAEGTFWAGKYAVTPGSLPGDWDLRETVGRGRLLAAPAAVRVETGSFAARRVADFSLPAAGVLRGRVLRGDGSALTRGTVLLSSWEGTSLYRVEAPIGPGGEFELTGLPPGPIKVAARDADTLRESPPQWARAGIEGFLLHTEPLAGDMDELDSGMDF